MKFEDYKNRLEADQIENKINHSERSEIDVDSLKGVQKEFIKNNKVILKTRQRLTSKKHNAFTEEINRIALSWNDGQKAINSFDRNNTSRMNKDLVCKKEDIKCNNIIKQYENV